MIVTGIIVHVLLVVLVLGGMLRLMMMMMMISKMSIRGSGSVNVDVGSVVRVRFLAVAGPCASHTGDRTKEEMGLLR